MKMIRQASVVREVKNIVGKWVTKVIVYNAMNLPGWLNMSGRLLEKIHNLRKPVCNFLGGNLTTDMWLNEEGKRKIN